jgi:Domain of unknown function (DUF4124)
MKLLSTILGLAFLSVCSSAVAQWQWVDKDGRRVFSDRAPPLEVLDKDIVKRPSTPVRVPLAKEAKEASNADATSAASEEAPSARSTPLAGGVDKELEAKKKQAADAEAAKRRAEEDRITKAKIENCARAKQSMAGLDAGLRISRTNTAGEREVMDDGARAGERARIQTIMNSECR